MCPKGGKIIAKIQEGRNLVKKAVVSGLEPSSLVINEIARGYCEKKDFDDLLSFFAEMKCAPTVIAGNKVIHCVCSNSGTSANLFLQELELVSEMIRWEQEISLYIF